MLAAAEGMVKAGVEGKLQSTMAEAYGLAPRAGRPDLLLSASLRMPGQRKDEVTKVNRKDSEGKDFTMTYPSKSAAMSNKHGEVFYPLARAREGAYLVS